ncbi:hypothetical protein DUNSADRAFT_4760 [Dunaliella salina]|uniref:Fatty acid desaturase domain-containing protein n=1 Tax=Dunaliella salina TaxID=3046 RepID=A0ABQ7GAU3_DUNSA|nr:hypothetical protein DUNSADRAFT_4760 [Dunaliella salina]|eukprot:KAF5837140.1 hypothetical protein DUNSADRAFT_4760 [Dunaliella salina]
MHFCYSYIFATISAFLLSVHFWQAICASHAALSANAPVTQRTWHVSFHRRACSDCSHTLAGHCGYRQPLWLAFLQSWGVCFTPGVAHAKTHYIHHLDPRFNRALYFTWWVMWSVWSISSYSEHLPRLEKLKA